MKFSEYKYERPDYAKATKEYNALAERVRKADSLEKVTACVDEHELLLQQLMTAGTISEVRHTIDTTDEFYKTEVDVSTQEMPAVGQAMSEFQLALLQSPFRAQLEKLYCRTMFINAELAVKTTSPEVVELLAKEGALQMEYQSLQASAQLDFEGETRTLAQLGVFKTDKNPEMRRSAFCAEGGFYIDNKAEFDRIYDELVKIRTEIAHKLGFPSFVELAYCRQTRNCYDADMVKNFRNEVKKHLVPLVAKLKQEQAGRLGLPRVRFQDDAVLFPEGNPRPVGNYDDTYASGIKLYREMSPETREYIDFMDSHELFSLIATKGKAAGGYCTFIPTYHSPFIFSNFNGTAGDVEVFTHEGGHAFQAYVADKNFKMLEEGEATMETCEVHSMSMEFLAWPWLESFYGDRTDEAKQAHLLNALFFIPYGCMVDEFQHIVYEKPELTPEQRNAEWARLESEYRPYLDFDGIPFYSDGRGWQRQLHIYLYPFYYIDYCLAQSVALQIFALMRNEGWESAWKHYYAFLEKGGTLTFTELLAQAGLSDPFKPGAMETVCKTVENYIEK